ncbi:hypothetical protein [Streptomyces sp. NPDC056132]|uniref:hypothetical protein n=1 Tax=Streptomyces sp. NPDC056132 TaxID=3345722 RepID=UPI0035DD32ED
MAQAPDPQDRPHRAGCAALTLSVAAVGLLALGAALVLAVSAFPDRTDTPPEELLAKKAGLTAYRLNQAARDGSLTDQEIVWAADGPWIVQREPRAIRIVARYTPGPACYEFVLVQPMEAPTSLQLARLEQCPLFPERVL